MLGKVVSVWIHGWSEKMTLKHFLKKKYVTVIQIERILLLNIRFMQKDFGKNLE